MFGVYGLFFVSGLAVGSLYALGGIGLVVLRRSTGVLNFAYGAIAACAAMLCWQSIRWGAPEPMGWMVAIVVGILLSVLYGRLIAPYLAWREPAVKSVATLGFTLVLLGLASWYWDDTARKLSLPTDSLAVQILGVRVTLTRILAFASSVAIVLALTIFLERTRTGLHMRALADDRAHSALLGLPVVRIETLAWGLSGALAGFTGLLFGDLVRLDPTVITYTVIPAIAAAVCGRLVSLPATLFGGLAIGVLEAMLTLYKPAASLRAMTPFVVAGAVILFQQRGQRLTFATTD